MSYIRTLTALADPTRRAIFERLRPGPRSVGELARGLPVTRPAVSQHLRVLERASLVRVQRAGRSRIYSVEVAGLDELRRYLERFWDDVLDSFREEAERTATAPGRAGAHAPDRPPGVPTGTNNPRAGSKNRRKHG
jgi:DNA-binding transcriptional ArsR family regulator